MSVEKISGTVQNRLRVPEPPGRVKSRRAATGLWIIAEEIRETVLCHVWVDVGMNRAPEGVAWRRQTRSSSGS